jgi:hypothetical protein
MQGDRNQKCHSQNVLQRPDRSNHYNKFHRNWHQEMDMKSKQMAAILLLTRFV